ncbi:Hypothetical protein Cul131001_2090 [Corynebacterium ulcerans]|nr:Hypothetical protein Cul131001_2090 [Corynebacterium ulcerans]
MGFRWKPIPFFKALAWILGQKNQWWPGVGSSEKPLEFFSFALEDSKP